MTHLGHPFVEAIDRLDSLGVRDGDDVRSKSNEIAMFPVQMDMRPFCLPAPYIEETPPVRVPRKGRTRVFVQSLVEFVSKKMDDHDRGDNGGPVPNKKR